MKDSLEEVSNLIPSSTICFHWLNKNIEYCVLVLEFPSWLLQPDDDDFLGNLSEEVMSELPNYGWCCQFNSLCKLQSIE